MNKQPTCLKQKMEGGNLKGVNKCIFSNAFQVILKACSLNIYATDFLKNNSFFPGSLRNYNSVRGCKQNVLSIAPN